MKYDIATVILVVFCVLGFGVNLFVRVIFIYLDLQNGEDINWWRQVFLTFAVPAACIYAILESMATLGFFSSQPAVFDFSQQIR
jgi:hypothetical protein